jgi:hypothetical protein
MPGAETTVGGLLLKLAMYFALFATVFAFGYWLVTLF